MTIPIPTPVRPLPDPKPDPGHDDPRKKDDLKTDDLTKIEGIGPKAAAFLYQEGITTFMKLAETDIERIRALVEKHGWENIMYPETWPKQARLADIAKVSGKEIDRNLFDDYKNYLKRGRLPGKSKKPVQDDPDYRKKDDYKKE
jgi:hypothetical protein